MQRMKLIDISKWDGSPADAAKVAAQGYEGVLCRASYGLTKDPLFQYYWSLFRGKLKRYAYHYFMPAYDYRQQLLVMNTQLALDYGEGNHFCDVESTGGILPTSRIFDMAHNFCLYADQTIPHKVPMGIYTGKWFWEPNGGLTQQWVVNENRHLWAASYPYDKRTDIKTVIASLERTVVSSELLQPLVPKPWTIAKLWQWSAKGTVAGIVAGDVDLDVTVEDRAIYRQEMGWVDLPIPTSLEGVVIRLLALEEWAATLGYKIGG